MSCPPAEAPASDEIERTLLEELEEPGGSSKRALWDLARLYSRTNRQDQAFECVRKFAALTDDLEEQASCWLAMGQLSEQVKNFDAAVGFYREGLALNPGSVLTRYFIHNNLGYSLVQVGRFKEAEPLLEAAITIDPTRPNAFKNLGLAMLSQGRIAEAADYFVLATETNAADARAFKHLEQLIVDHPDVLLAIPGLAEHVVLLRGAVENAAEQQPEVCVRWKRLRRRPKRRS
jgi:tetratricopeptide (TPR) repeat protein